jgi:hypothetical protein
LVNEPAKARSTEEPEAPVFPPEILAIIGLYFEPGTPSLLLYMRASGRAVYNLLLSHLYSKVKLDFPEYSPSPDTKSPTYKTFLMLSRHPAKRSYIRTLQLYHAPSAAFLPKCVNLVRLHVHIDYRTVVPFGRLRLPALEYLSFQCNIPGKPPRNFAPSFPALVTMNFIGYAEIWLTKALAESCGPTLEVLKTVLELVDWDDDGNPVEASLKTHESFLAKTTWCTFKDWKPWHKARECPSFRPTRVDLHTFWDLYDRPRVGTF